MKRRPTAYGLPSTTIELPIYEPNGPAISRHRARRVPAGAARQAQRQSRFDRPRLCPIEPDHQSVAFTKQYRSYVINYGLGMDMIRADIERAGASPQTRWKRMERLLSEPTLPSDLKS